MSKVYLALYKGRKSGRTPKALAMRLADWVIRKATRSIYSHCEIAVHLSGGGYACYSSSIRDGGVRVKKMDLPSEKWDLIELPGVTAVDLDRVWQAAQGKRYDWSGAIGTVLKIRQRPDKWFCS
jgi:identified by metaGeneAnnotator